MKHHHRRLGHLLLPRNPTLLTACLALMWLAVVAHAQTPQPMPNLDLWDNGVVYVIHPDGSGGYYIGGSFRQVQGVPRRNLAHIRADGTVNPAFAPEVSNSVFTIQTSGSDVVLIGGGFANVNGVARARVAKLSATGVLDPDWNPSANGNVERLRVDGAGRVYLAGSFTTVGGVTRNRLARVAIAGDGVPDEGWQPSANGPALAVEPMLDGRVWVSGNFTAINGMSPVSTALLKADGEIEFYYSVGVRNMVLDASGRLYMCGSSAIGRILPSLLYDLDWWAPVNGAVHDCDLDGDSLLVSGRFTQIGGQPRHGTARIGIATGAPVDPAWTVSAVSDFNGNAGVENWAITRVNGAQVAIGGPLRQVDGQPRAGLALVAASDGSAQAPMNVERPGSVAKVASFADGSSLAAGVFWRAGADTRMNLLRLTPAGVVDPDWNIPVLGSVRTMVADPVTQEAWVGGGFGTVAGQSRANLFKIANASVPAIDPAWAPVVNSWVTVLHRELSTNRIYVGGTFTAIDGITRHRLARLAGTGASPVDGWNPNIGNGQINAIAQPWGFDIWIGGSFTSAGGSLRNHLAIFDTGPSADLSGYDPSPNGTVWALHARSDLPGDIYVGGEFSTIAGQARNYLASFGGDGLTAWNPGINVTPVVIRPDGKGQMYLGGGFTQVGGVERLRLARVQATGTGTVDPDFHAQIDSGVRDLSLRPDGVLIAGDFVQVNGQTRRNLALLSAEAGGDAIFANGFESSPPAVPAGAAALDSGCVAAPMMIGQGVASVRERDPYCAAEALR